MAITNEQIRALRDEAKQALDYHLASICDLALGGEADANCVEAGYSDSVAARAECARVIADAAAQDDEVAHGYTFSGWLEAAGRSDSASEYDLRAAWRAGESPEDYAV